MKIMCLLSDKELIFQIREGQRAIDGSFTVLELEELKTALIRGGCQANIKDNGIQTNDPLFMFYLVGQYMYRKIMVIKSCPDLLLKMNIHGKEFEKLQSAGFQKELIRDFGFREICLN